MISLKDVTRNLVTYNKDLVNDQTLTGLTVRLNQAGVTFTSNGLGTTTETSTAVLAHAGGFNDQSVVATMKYLSPSTSANMNFGVFARLQSLENTGVTTYYYAHVASGTARITRVVGGSFTILTSASYALAADTFITITFNVVSNALSATFVAAGGSPSNVSLSATDSSITTGGMCGFRTISRTGFCSSISVQEL